VALDEVPPCPPVALYVHVPFCISICPYCDFVVYAGSSARGPRNSVDAFVMAARREITMRGRDADEAFGADRPALASVYFGGGTPSLLGAAQIAAILAEVARAFRIEPGAEITLEANPGAADLGDLAGFRAAGINRLSIGAQSLDADELRRIGRRHSPADVETAVHAARRAGFDNVSLDLLYDVPGQTIRSWNATLARVAQLDVEHVSAYALTLDLDERKTEGGRFDRPDDRFDRGDDGLDRADGRLHRADDHLPVRPGALRWRRFARTAQDDDRAADMYALADRRLSASGFAWYEISNWARPGRESRHNLAYWTGLAYEGVGPGAHAYDGGRVRRWNAARLDAYIAALGAAALPPAGHELMSADVARAERAILALRVARGLDRAVTSRPELHAGLQWAHRNGLVEETADAVRLTLRGRLLGNAVFEGLL
jgi:coproporphyrinogen III oxidase-like Fe-S oxidoreductase